MKSHIYINTTTYSVSAAIKSLRGKNWKASEVKHQILFWDLSRQSVLQKPHKDGFQTLKFFSDNLKYHPSRKQIKNCTWYSIYTCVHPHRRKSVN